MLGLDALPGEVVQVGHHASDLLSRGHLGVAFYKEPGNRKSRWQLLLMSCLNGQVISLWLRLERTVVGTQLSVKNGVGDRNMTQV